MPCLVLREKPKALVAFAATGIGEALPGFGNELPVISVGLERELQDAEGRGIAQFAVGLWRAERTVILAAGANDEFADAARGIGRAIGRLRGKTLVFVIVAGDHDIRVGFVERLEERLNSEVVAVGATGAKERLVPVGKRAGGGMRGEIGAQPFILGRTGFAATDVLALAVQHDDVPGTEFVAVVAGLRVAGSRAKIIEVRRGARGTKFVVAGRRTRAGFRATPRFVVAGEIFLAAVGVGKIADGHDSAGDFVEELCRGFRTGKILAVRDIARADEDCSLLVGWRYA